MLDNEFRSFSYDSKMERDLHLARAGSNGNLLNGTYKFIRNLGHGAFGKVKVASHLPTGCKVAIKILNRRKIREKEMEDKAKGISTFGMDKGMPICKISPI